MALAALIFPLINASRASSQITACANNLRELGVALTAYSEHHNGMFPQVPERGNLGAAGVFGPTLVDAGYLRDPRMLVCPGSPLADRADFHIPTLDELRSAKADRLKELQRDMGGSYGYALGYRDNGIYKPTRNLRRETFAIAADMPAEDLTEHQTSPNHGWSGHNVLLEGGRVVYLKNLPSGRLGRQHLPQRPEPNRRRLPRERRRHRPQQCAAVSVISIAVERSARSRRSRRDLRA